MWLLEVVTAFEKLKVSYALVGGYAVALHGAVRGTLDIDVIIPRDEDSFLRAERALSELGLVSRLPVNAKEVYAFREEYIKNRNLVAWSFYHPHEMRKVVDIVITHNAKDVGIKRVKIENQSVRIIAIGDLIEMKRASGRPQDLADIAALERLRG